MPDAFHALEETVTRDVTRALAEDVGTGDLTANLVPVDARAAARLMTRQSGVLCGVEWFNRTFQELEGKSRQVFKGVRGKKERQQLEKLLEACKEGELAAVRSILRTDPKLSTASGPIGFLEEVTPLHVAACFGHANIAEFLLSKGVPVEALDDTFVMTVTGSPSAR